MYKVYQELICKCLSNGMYTELTHMGIPYDEIIYIYRKAHVVVM